jgi:AraC family transcriptional regulator
LHEIVCRAGSSDRPFEERHDGFSISAVVAGSFTYRSDAGEGLLYPGALLMGNSGRCFECGHAHSAGDRCISLNVHEDQFGEIAATAASSSGFRFPALSLPPLPKVLPVVAHMEALAFTGSSLRCEELAMGIVERVIAAFAGDRRLRSAPTWRETKRVVAVIRLVEADPSRALELGELAAAAAMSKYHFLRVFRSVMGVTPHQYLIGVRLRRAARALSSSRRPVLDIALDSGFGDLSTFNKTFRATFGLTPTRYRESTGARLGA